MIWFIKRWGPVPAMVVLLIATVVAGGWNWVTVYFTISLTWVLWKWCKPWK